jgi:polyisoprenoid-binding protein YceI
VHVAFTLKIKGDAATAMGEADVDRTVFGVGQGEWAATDQIPAKVRVRFAITATKEISR